MPLLEGLPLVNLATRWHRNALLRFSLVGVLGGVACGGPREGQVTRGSLHEEIPCSSPTQPGCSHCCEEMLGPANEVICFRRSLAESRSRAGTRGYGQGELLVQGPCPGDCRHCARCTVDKRESYDTLVRSGCDCNDPQIRFFMSQGDPCFGYGCPCVCDQLRQLSECAADR